MKTRKKILIIGHARHGKDTAAAILSELFGFTSRGSSEAAAEIFLYDRLKDKYGYKSFMECFEDRVNHRDEWFNNICEYNMEDKARLAKDIMSKSDIYTGMRSNAECDECLQQGVFDMVIGIFDPRKPLESERSFDIDMWAKSDVVVPNGTTLRDFKLRLFSLKPLLFKN